MKNLPLKTVFIILVFWLADVKSQELMTYQKPINYKMPPKKIPTIREYWVSLPKDYDETTNKYPIIFLFDGDEAYLRNLILFNADQLTKLGDIPPCIIVGVIQRNRALDFGPLYALNGVANSDKVNGDKFFDFIKEELLPELKHKYRTKDFKVGIGHSLGGLFLLNSFTKDPEFFNGIIAISPALEMNRDSTLFSKLKTTLNTKINKQTFLCWASGTEGINEVTFGPASKVLNRLLIDNPNPSVKYRFIDLPGKNHSGTPIFSMLGALDFLFDDWNITKWYRGLFYDKNIEPINAYKVRNAIMKEKYGFNDDPTEDRIQNNVGLQLMTEKKFSQALPYLKRAIQMKPTSSGYNEDLSEAEEQLKNYSSALAALRVALVTIDKNAEDYDDRLEKYNKGIKRLEGLIK